MNENIDLSKILKDCPKGTKLYSTIFGCVEFLHVLYGGNYPIKYITSNGTYESATAKGLYRTDCEGECTLFPSREQRDWDKFAAPWLKKERFDPKTLCHYDRVLVRDGSEYNWSCDLFSHIVKNETTYTYLCVSGAYEHCIPYNDDTKHLVGTNEKAPEYYQYWED